MKKCKNILCRSLAAASAALCMSTAAPVNTNADYYMLESPETYYTHGMKFSLWDDMTSYLDIADTQVALSQDGNRLIAMTHDDNGELMASALNIIPSLYSVSEEKSAEIVEFVKEKYPQVIIETNRYEDYLGEYRLSMNYLYYPQLEMQIAEDIKSATGEVCAYFIDENSFAVTVFEGEPTTDPDGLETLRDMPFEEFVAMSKDDICAVSDEAKSLYESAEKFMATSRNTFRANVVFRNKEAFSSKEAIAEKLGIPAEYIADYNYLCICYASSYGSADYSVDVSFDASANAELDEETLLLKINMWLTMNNAPDIVYVYYEQPGGGGGVNTEPAETEIVGDANCDGKVTMADATLILQYIGNSDKYKLTEKGKKLADCYNPGDGISTLDALAIQKYDAKVVSSLPESGKLPDDNAQNDENSDINDEELVVTVTVIDEETGELFCENDKFLIYAGGAVDSGPIGEGAGGGAYVEMGVFNSAETNPIVCKCISDEYKYYISYKYRYVQLENDPEYDGYGYSIDIEKSPDTFDFTESRKPNITIYMKKTFFKAVN